MLLDFGTFQKIEKSTQNSICLGTAYYTAPETFTTNQIDKRTDIYALGVTLYSLITGNDLSAPPYVIYPIRKINPTLSKGFEYIITKCMDQKPENRYQNMQELLTDLYNINKITYKLNNPTLLKKLISLFKKND